MSKSSFIIHIGGHAFLPGVVMAGSQPSGQISSSLMNRRMLVSDGGLARPTSEA